MEDAERRIMEHSLTLGEHVRHLRRRKGWGLQQLAEATGLSLTHLSRIENDSAVPNPGSVVKLANALGADLDRMLELAQCLPEEILKRLLRRADSDTPARRRAGGPITYGQDWRTPPMIDCPRCDGTGVEPKPERIDGGIS